MVEYTSISMSTVAMVSLIVTLGSSVIFAGILYFFLIYLPLLREDAYRRTGKFVDRRRCAKSIPIPDRRRSEQPIKET